MYRMTIERAWRTVIINSAADLRIDNGFLVIQNERTVEIPICEIRHLIVQSNAVSLSVAVINAMTANGTMIVFSGKDYIPSSVVMGIQSHSNYAGNIITQTKWADIRKKELWKIIVKQKIKNQAALAIKLGLSSSQQLSSYAERVDEGETEGIEGVAARVYFKSLFGHNFIRHEESEINSALNYGYVVVCTMFTRILTMHGYTTALGIHHCSATNMFHLSCDLMEPFRPFVDSVVYENRNKTMCWEYKKTILMVLHSKVMYAGKTMDFCDAAESFSLDVLASMKNQRRTIKEICFVW